MSKEARWCVEEQATGLTVAQGSAPTAEAATAEAMHYAVQYAHDGAVRFWVRQNRKTVAQGLLLPAVFRQMWDTEP